MTRLAPYRKAIVAALTAGIGAAITAATDNQITLVEWLTIGGAVVGALGVTYQVPNTVDHAAALEAETAADLEHLAELERAAQTLRDRLYPTPDPLEALHRDAPGWRTP